MQKEFVRYKMDVFCCRTFSTLLLIDFDAKKAAQCNRIRCMTEEKHVVLFGSDQLMKMLFCNKKDRFVNTNEIIRA